jgi:hypothetical protein
VDYGWSGGFRECRGVFAAVAAYTNSHHAISACWSSPHVDILEILPLGVDAYTGASLSLPFRTICPGRKQS